MKTNNFFTTFLKGVAMGTANIIPGVSGGTIALITGIFERLINAIKSFDITAAKLLLKGKFKEFTQKIDFYFLISLFLGIGAAIISLAKIFDFLFKNHPIYIWSFFFGLILASIYFVGKTISKWNINVIIAFIIGTAIAISLTFMNPAVENNNLTYLIICGVVATCSMILPGLSGSFVLILMGNYQLIAIDAINNMRFDILIPVAIGAVIGLIGLSHLLSWIFKKWRNITIATLTGFILGSLGIIWPWKKEVYMTDVLGNIVVKNGEPIIEKYSISIPNQIDYQLFMAIIFIVIGVLTIWLIEKFAQNKQS